MLERTRALWEKQNGYDPDRWQLFTAVADVTDAERVLYPGSFVDIAASFVFPSVTYVDVDKRAASFFADADGVDELISAHRGAPRNPRFEFIHTDYSSHLHLPLGAFDLLVSLYAGFISEACTEYLRIGGTLLVTPSHGDAAMASIDPRYELCGVIPLGAGGYRVATDDLAAYLIPKKSERPTIASLHASGRGVAYTRDAFAYLFQRIG